MTELRATRETLYAVMERCTDMIIAMTIDQCEDFLGSYAYQDYKAAERAAIDERNPAALATLVQQMNAALDRLNT